MKINTDNGKPQTSDTDELRAKWHAFFKEVAGTKSKIEYGAGKDTDAYVDKLDEKDGVKDGFIACPLGRDVADTQSQLSLIINRGLFAVYQKGVSAQSVKNAIRNKLEKVDAAFLTDSEGEKLDDAKPLSTTGGTVDLATINNYVDYALPSFKYSEIADSGSIARMNLAKGNSIINYYDTHNLKKGKHYEDAKKLVEESKKKIFKDPLLAAIYARKATGTETDHIGKLVALGTGEEGKIDLFQMGGWLLRVIWEINGKTGDTVTIDQLSSARAKTYGVDTLVSFLDKSKTAFNAYDLESAARKKYGALDTLPYDHFISIEEAEKTATAEKPK